MVFGWSVALGCGAGPAAPTSAGENLQLRLQTDHFRMLGDRVSDQSLRGAADRLEANFARITSELGVAGMTPITVKIWQDETAFAAELRRYFGQSLNATGYVTGRDELRVLATPQLQVTVVHEFAHAVSLYVNPSFGNNPRWFWETVALYENREFVNPRTLDYLVRGSYPSLQQLSVDVNAGRQIYELGFVLGEFIVSRWGEAGFRRLIATGGDLQGALGVSAAEFETAWQAWVRERYLS